MKRQEFLLNLTLLVIIGALIFFIYEAKDQPSSLDELDVTPVAASADGSTSATKSQSRRKHGANGSTTDSDRGTSGSKKRAGKDAPPGTETNYRSTPGTATADEETTASDEGTSIASAAASPGRGGNFGQRNLFRAILTPTPTPPPPTPTPAPTPNISAALGSWRLLSVYEGKAMMEDVKLSEAGAEGAIWEMSQGDTKQVEVGNGIMKTATLKKIDNENPYNPEVVFGLEGTTTERKINLDTEPVTSGKK